MYSLLQVISCELYVISMFDDQSQDTQQPGTSAGAVPPQTGQSPAPGQAAPVPPTSAQTQQQAPPTISVQPAPVAPQSPETSSVQPEPIDIFDDVDPAAQTTHPPQQNMTEGATSGMSTSDNHFLKILMRVLVVVLVVVIVGGLLAYGIWWFMGREVVMEENVEQQPIGATENMEETNEESAAIKEPVVVIDDTLSGPSENIFLEEEIIQPEENIPLDTDKDGLTDVEERDYGTNINLLDTDKDGLTDYEEVHTFRTDPLNNDTDGDTYLDGDEVRNGYNPAGEGKLVPPPSNQQPLTNNL